MLDQLLAADTDMLLWIGTLPRPDWLTALMIGTTLAGTYGLVWLGIGVAVTALRRDAGPLWRLALALLLAWSLVDMLVKPAVGRLRPFDLHAHLEVTPTLRPSDASFPSGHAASAAAGAYALTRVVPAASAPLWVLALIVAGSRVYLGVHFPLDVAAGLPIGLACGVFATGRMRYPRVRTPGRGAREPPTEECRPARVRVYRSRRTAVRPDG